jgi:adenine phosphoribosyltransferase
MVSVKTGQILGIGHVPSDHWPPDAVRPKNEADLLWALKGAGTNIGIVLSVTFRTFPAGSYLVRDWVIPVNGPLEAQSRLSHIARLTDKMPRHCSADAYLHWESGELQLGVTAFEYLSAELSLSMPRSLIDSLGPAASIQTVDCVGLFDCEMYISRMHGGHGSGKTSSFKRCVFLKNIGKKNIADILVEAIKACPSPLCYLHLLHGGGAIRDVTIGATAFGSRDWDYACVITGVWPRNQDTTDGSYSAIQWVYDVARDLLPFSNGVYSADLGPDPRDANLAAKAFGPNGPRLANMKRVCDPHCVLVYACPVPKIPPTIILVTGRNCSGKDYCASIWASSINTIADKTITARVASISDATKRAYAEATRTDLDRLLRDRAYKEQHRVDLTDFYQRQVKCRPQLPEEHFLDVVGSMVGVDVLFITGMRDKAPVAVFSRLVPNTKLIEVNVEVNEEIQRARQGCSSDGCLLESDRQPETGNATSSTTALDYHPSLTFHNNVKGIAMAEKFAERWLLPLFHADLQQLAGMIRSIPDFPRSGIDFRHVLNIAQKRGGLKLCVSLLQTHFTGDWSKVDAIACCQAAGFIIGSGLSIQVEVPLVLIREGGKLPPPTVSVLNPGSHISSVGLKDGNGRVIELEEELLSSDASVVVVDDVFASGRTLCAVLQLLHQVGISSEKIQVIVVAVFPAHGGRGFLHEQGFGGVNIQSLLVLGGFKWIIFNSATAKLEWMAPNKDLACFTFSQTMP